MAPLTLRKSLILVSYILGFLVEISCSGIAHAGVCGTSETGFASIEAREELLLSGRYPEFFGTFDGLSGVTDDVKKSALDFLSSKFPSGFKSCEVVLDESLPPAMRRGIVVLISDDGEFFFFGYLSAKIGGTWDIWTFWMGNELQKVLANLPR